MARYRLLEIRDKFINDGEPYWVVEKHILGLWWSSYFEEHNEWSATYYNKDEAMKWYEYHIDKESRVQVKIIAQNK
jgi:hypothetical protein